MASSIFPGFNTEIDCDDIRYHIQTEVLGAPDPAILTLVYRAGAIVNRVKRNYRDVLGEQPIEDEVRFLAERQHRRVIAELEAAQTGYGGPAAHSAEVAPAANEIHPEDGLDRLIEDYLGN